MKNIFAVSLTNRLFWSLACGFFFTATARATSQASLEQGDARLQRMEMQLLQEVNRTRIDNGAKPLQWSTLLAGVARAHSGEMRDLGYFAHESPTLDLKTPLDRYMKVASRSPRLIAENIFRSWGSRHELSAVDVQRAHDALMKSPGHRANILRKNVTFIGIGFVSNENGDLWVTQLFLLP